MLLRKIIQHVREQNWTAVAIDFFIVVLGVFVGMQVTNWNESRLEAQRAHGYLARIRADLGSDIQAAERRVAYWNKVIGYGHKEKLRDELAKYYVTGLGPSNSAQALAEQVTQDLRQ